MNSEKLKEMLIEMKNLTEFIIDLAYSALMLNSKEMAQEVKNLESYIDDLCVKMELTALSMQRSPEESKELLSLIRIGVASEQIADAALRIAEVVLKETFHPILPVVIDEAEETITKVTLSEGSVLVGKTLKELNLLDKLGQKVIAIQRAKKWIYRPDKETKLQAGDILLTRGFLRGSFILEKLASAQLSELPSC